MQKFRPYTFSANYAGQADAIKATVAEVFFQPIDKDTTGKILVFKMDGLVGLAADINSSMVSDFIYFVSLKYLT